MLSPEERQDIQRLAQTMSVRALARKLGRNPRTIRRALGRRPPPTPPPKLDPFQDLARDLFQKGLFAPRILRELQARGYTGSRTILLDFLRSLRPRPAKAPKVHRRFETAPAQEAQIDWSPYRLQIGGEERVAHCFSMILCHSRRLWIGFFRNERLPTLLHAHVEAFAYHGGVCHRLVYDNQTAVTLGRLGGQPLWNPDFYKFVQHYGFKPFAHKPAHKERSGKVERPFYFIETDFLPNRTFASWDDLNRQAREWLDTVANVRVHGTTHRPIPEAYAEEKPLLIRLPDLPFPTDRRELRKVQTDGTVLVDGSFYPVPGRLVGQWVTVCVSPTRLEVRDAADQVVSAHAVPDRPMRLPTDGGPVLPLAAALSRPVLETRFLARFPGAAAFLDGLKRRMNALTPIHLRHLDRLADLYGDVALRAALERATLFRNFSAPALERILQAAHPHVVPEPPVRYLAARPEALAALDDVDSGSPLDYTFDSQDPLSPEDPSHDD